MSEGIEYEPVCAKLSNSELIDHIKELVRRVATSNEKISSNTVAFCTALEELYKRGISLSTLDRK